MALNLHHTVSGQGPPVVLVHGLFGMGSNLGALARSLVEDFRVYSIDLPNHGRSAWVDSMTLAELAGHVDDWCAAQGLEAAAWVGHSLGGKVAMELALGKPDRVDRLVVADIAPVEYPPHHDAVFAALDAVAAAGCASRREAAAIMDEYLEEPGVADFLLLSLARGDDGIYRWRFNLDGLKRGYGAVREPPAGARSFSGPVLFVKGEDSDYIQPAHSAVITALFPQVELKVIPGAGHWLHAQQPRLFNSVVGRFLRREG